MLRRNRIAGGSSHHHHQCLWMLLAALSVCLLPSSVQAQRFLREGFSNQMDSDVRAESKLDEDESLSGMTREMFLMLDSPASWELLPPVLDSDSVDPSMRRHLQKYLSHAPLALKLSKQKGKYGLRAVGQLENGKKLRAFWRQGRGNAERLNASEFLKASYDEAVRSRLFLVDIEVMLPRLKKQQPSVIYSVAVEPGSMNPKAFCPRGAGQLLLNQRGSSNVQPKEIGSCNLALTQKAGLVDPSWAKGRAVFRKGRSTGVM